ncbi:MAG: hypothetical protein ABR521_05685 [Gaiellaceae bacterium]
MTPEQRADIRRTIEEYPARRAEYEAMYERFTARCRAEIERRERRRRLVRRLLTLGRA